MTDPAPPVEPHPCSARSVRLRVEHADDESRVVVALDNAGEVVGLASAGISRDGDDPRAWELYAINTVLPVRGSGVADALLGAALEGRPASVWVVVGNDRARSFYRRHGFGPDGALRAHEGSGAPEERMTRPAGAGAVDRATATDAST